MGFHLVRPCAMKEANARHLWRPILWLALLLSSSAWPQEQQESEEELENQDAREVLEDTLEAHRPWWMPREPRERRQKLLPDSAFSLQVEEDTKLSLDEVVAQIRGSYDGRVVRATETEDGFVVRLLLEEGRLRTLHVSPAGRVVRAHLGD